MVGSRNIPKSIDHIFTNRTYFSLPHSGPKIKLFNLKVSELPDHTMVRIMSTADPDCDPTDNAIEPVSPTDSYRGNRPRPTRRRQNRGRGGRKPAHPSEASTINEPQSDTSMTIEESKTEEMMSSSSNKGHMKLPEHHYPAEPVHEPRESGAGGRSSQLSIWLSLVALVFCLVR